MGYILLSFCSEWYSMMLLPSGRSNGGDVHPTSNANNTNIFLTRSSSPLSKSISTSSKTENADCLPSPTMSLSSSFTPAIPTMQQEGNTSMSAPNSTHSTPASYSPQTTHNVSTTTGVMLHSNSPGSQSETGTTTSGRFGDSASKGSFLPNGNVSSSVGALATVTPATIGNWEEIDRNLEALQSNLKHGWSAHLGKEGRLYYCK